MNNIKIFDLLNNVGFNITNSEMRRIITLGGIKINNCKVESENEIINNDDYINGKLVISLGCNKKITLENYSL